MSGDRERAAWIYSQLYLVRKGAADIAKELKPPVSRSFVAAVIRGDKVSKRVRQAVAKTLGRKFKDVWGKKPVFQGKITSS